MKKIIGMLFLLSSTLFGRQITLEQAIDLSLENSKEMTIATKSIEKARLNVHAAFKNALPNVVYNGVYTRTPHARKVKDGDHMVNARGGYTQKLIFSQPLFQGGAIIGGIKYANIAKDMANLSYMAQKRDVRLSTIAIYSDIVKNQKNLDVLMDSKKDLTAKYEKQKAQLELRLITKSDLLKTEYTLTDIDTQIIATKNKIQIGKEQLKIKTGIPRNENIDVIDFEVPENLSAKIDFEKDLQQAINESIDSLLANNNVKIAEVQKTVARADMLPKISAFASYGVDQDRKKISQTSDDATWRGGIQVTWNVFDFGKDYDKYRVAKINEEQEELREQISHDNIDIKVTDAYLTLKKLENERVAKEQALKAAEENYRIDSEKYQAGLISTVDFLISETQLRDSKVRYNQIIVDYLYAFEKYRSMLI